MIIITDPRFFFLSFFIKKKYYSCIIYHHNLTLKFACTYIQSLDSFGDASGDASKSGFWGVLAQKAKEILEDDNPSAQSHDNDITSAQKLRSQSFNTTYIPGARAQVNIYIYTKIISNVQCCIPCMPFVVLIN
jgi:hypothetical protein